MPETEIDSFTRETGYSGFDLRTVHPSQTSWYSALGISFKTPSTGYFLSRVVWYIRCVNHPSNCPTGELVARLYSHSGIYGTSSLPGNFLAESDPVDPMTIPSNYTYISFYFSGRNRHYLAPNSYYCVALIAKSGTFNDVKKIRQRGDLDTSTHDGNSFLYYSGSWSILGNREFNFYVGGVLDPFLAENLSVAGNLGSLEHLIKSSLFETMRFSITYLNKIVLKESLNLLFLLDCSRKIILLENLRLEPIYRIIGPDLGKKAIVYLQKLTTSIRLRRNR